MRVSLFFCFIFSLGVMPLPGWALSGSIVDLDLSPIKKEADQTIEKSFTLKFSRNLRRSGEDFFDIDQKSNIFDTLSIGADLTLSAPLKRFSYCENYEFLTHKSLVMVLSYGSPVLYNNSKIKKDHCWGSVFCLRNLSLGVASAPFKRKNFHGTYSIYLNLPVSKFRIQKQSYLLGIGAALNMGYKLFSKKGFHISALSSHFVDIDGYRYKKEKDHRSYNKPLSMAHQLGLQFYSPLSPLMPLIYIYTGHGSSLRFSGVFQQQANISLSTVWLVGKKLRLLIGLRWGDEVLSENIAATTEKRFFADDTYVTFGGNYLF